MKSLENCHRKKNTPFLKHQKLAKTSPPIRRSEAAPADLIRKAPERSFIGGIDHGIHLQQRSGGMAGGMFT